MPLIYLMRHAESQANKAGVLAGRDDAVSLTSKGFKDSKQAVKYLRKLEISQIYSSPIKRCLQTVSPFAKEVGITPSIDNLLIEMDFGTWSGKKLSELSKTREWRKIQDNPAAFRFPEGESFKEMHLRVEKFLKRVSRGKKPILVVSHGDVIKMIICCCLDLPINQFQRIVITPASLSIIEYTPKSKALLQSNMKLSKGNFKDKATKFLLGGENA